MNITDYHVKYFAYELTKRCASDSLEKLSSTLSNAQVDFNPFNQKDVIVISSYHFARAKSPYIKQTKWDIAVIDEAHHLRNVYKSSNKIAKEIKSALSEAPKILLTATPLQNSLLELYGLVSITDDHVFGDIKIKNTVERI